MNRPLQRAEIEQFASLLAEKRRRQAKALHRTRGYRDKAGVWRGGLLEFVRYFWPILEPGTKFVDGWALEAVCEHLEAVTFGEITNLLVNVPPGFMKEVHVDEPVLTRRGRIRLGDVVVGDFILTHKGRYRRVSRIADKRQQPTLLISTWAGRKVRAEVRHPFLTPRGWVEARDLKVGDMLAAVEAIDDLPNLVSPEEARLLGYLVGDGSVGHSPVFHNTDSEMITDFMTCAALMGFSTSLGVVAPSLRAKGMVAARVGLKGSLRWLEKHGLRGTNSYTKRIPPLVLASGRVAIANFIGAYWSCDGMVKVRHKRARGDIHLSQCTTVSENLARDIQHALLRLGINSRVRQIAAKLESKKQPGGIYRSWNVISSGHEDTVKFKDMPGLCSRKNKPLQGLTLQKFIQGPLYEDEIIEITNSGFGECRCLTVEEDHSFTAGDLAVHNSLLTDVFWPAWEWGPVEKPHLRYVTFSYSASLTERDNGRFKDLITSTEYQAMYGSIVQVRATGATKVSNWKHGWKLASSVGGVGTGERGNRAIIDDPHNVKESESKLVRQETIRWFRESLSSRLNNMETDAKIVIMQRVNEEDVAGEIIGKMEGWCHLLIPMEYVWQADEETGGTYATDIGWVDPRWRERPEDCDGELAWEERFPARIIPGMKRDIGPFGWHAQYQQTPEVRGGAIFERAWWQAWQPADGKFPVFTYIVASCDSAFGNKSNADPSACVVLGVFENDFGFNRVMVIEAWSKNLKFSGPIVTPQPGEKGMAFLERQRKSWGLVEWLADTCTRRKVDRLLIENKASGISASQSLANSHPHAGWAVQLVEPKGDHWARAQAVQPTFSQEMVYIPWPLRQWGADLVDEMAIFDKGVNDDQVDAMTQGIKHLRDIGLLRNDSEIRQDLVEAAKPKGHQKKLYPGTAGKAA